MKSVKHNPEEKSPKTLNSWQLQPEILYLRTKRKHDFAFQQRHLRSSFFLLFLTTLYG